ncbi:MAG: hypothetical protein ACOC95_07455 [Planctomycetota bacterium]
MLKVSDLGRALVRSGRLVVAAALIAFTLGCEQDDESMTAGQDAVAPPQPSSAPATAPRGARLDEVRVYRDGGTLGVKVSTPDGTVRPASIDSRIGTSTPMRLYEGAMHPTEPAARLLPRGSRAEREWLALLTEAVKRDLTEAQRRAVLAGRTEGLTDRQLRAGQVLRRLEAIGVDFP